MTETAQERAQLKEIERNEQVRECVGKVRVEKRVGK